MANDSTGQSSPQYSVWKLLCQSPIEGQVDLEVVENRPACGGKTALGRLSQRGKPSSRDRSIGNAWQNDVWRRGRPVQATPRQRAASETTRQGVSAKHY